MCCTYVCVYVSIFTSESRATLLACVRAANETYRLASARVCHRFATNELAFGRSCGEEATEYKHHYMWRGASLRMKAHMDEIRFGE